MSCGRYLLHNAHGCFKEYNLTYQLEQHCCTILFGYTLHNYHNSKFDYEMEVIVFGTYN